MLNEVKHLWIAHLRNQRQRQTFHLLEANNRWNDSAIALPGARCRLTISPPIDILFHQI